MTQRTAALVITQRMMTEGEVAAYLGRDLPWFRRNRDVLAAHGFPEPLPGVDRFDRVAVDAWLDTQSTTGAALVFNG